MAIKIIATNKQINIYKFLDKLICCNKSYYNELNLHKKSTGCKSPKLINRGIILSTKL